MALLKDLKLGTPPFAECLCESNYKYGKCKGINILVILKELNYIEFDNFKNSIEFTDSGLNWLRNHFDKIKSQIKEHDIILKDFGNMTSYVYDFFENFPDVNFII